ncbi:MAG: hypothetical protein JKY94_17585 [Rhodobacteraceae bacterium]|nr:hypothetical protein [Paracoccaceae bacterium]
MIKNKQISEIHHVLQKAVAGYTTALRKEDIPAVEVEITLMQEAVSRLWEEGVVAVMAELLATLARIRQIRDDEYNQDVVVSIIASLFRNFQGDTFNKELFGGAAGRAILAGAESTGIEGFGRTAQFFRLTGEVEDDLTYWVRNRFREREQRIKDAVRGWALLPGSKREEMELVILDNVRAVVSDPDGHVSRYIVDLWAYRAFNQGVVHAAASKGIASAYLFNNPKGGGPDQKTTPFCRGVHGMQISVPKMVERWTEYKEEQRGGSYEGVKLAAPLLSFEESLLEGEEARAKIKSGKFGYPPFHSHCRTIVQIKRRSDGPRGK